MTEETLSNPICWRYICDEDIVIKSGQAVNIDGDTTVKIQGLTYPSTDGTNGQGIITDGSGNLSFGSVSGGSSTSICDADNDTCVEVERTTDDDTIRLKAAGTDVQTITEATTTIDNDVTMTNKMTIDSVATHILNQLHVDGKIEISVTSISAATYNIGDTEWMIEWIGTSQGIINLPIVSSNTGRKVHIVNHSSNNSAVWIHPATGDMIEGRINPIELDKKYCHISLTSDSNDNWMQS